MNEIKEVMRRYGKEAVEAEQLDIRSSNDVFRVKTRDGVYFLKRIFDRRPDQWRAVQAEIDIARHAHKKGIPTIPALRNIDGGYVTLHDGTLYTLYPYEELNGASEEDLPAAAKLLARFHEAMKDFPGRRFYTNPLHEAIEDITELFENNPRRGHEAVFDRAERDPDHAVSQRLFEHRGFLAEQVARILHTIRFMELSEETLLHYDFSSGNIHFRDGKPVALLDFEYSHRGHPETDVIKAAKFWADRDGRIDPLAFRRFVNEYRKHRPLKVDWRIYHRLLIYLRLRRLVHFARLTLEGKADLTDLFERDMKTVRWLAEHEDEFVKNAASV